MSAIESRITLSVVIPAYLEEKNIAQTLQSLQAYFANKAYRVEYVVVDDGSTDATSSVAEASGAKVIRFKENRGKGAAVRAGMIAAEGRFILFTDADHPYEIGSVETCLEKLGEGFDLVIGSRNLHGSDRGRELIKRRVISKVGNVVARLLILPGISDTQAGFKCFKREAAREIFSRTLIDGWGFDIEALFLARMLKYRIAEVPIKLIPGSIKPSRIHHPTLTAMNVLGSIAMVHRNRMMGKYKRP